MLKQLYLYLPKLLRFSQKPDPTHPYGRRNMRHIMSLVSGVGIFCIGSGVSICHGVQMLWHGSDTSDIATSMVS